jgi:hypothetical protein
MSQTFTIELTDIEVKGLNYVALSADEWIQNAIRERARLAIDELVNDDIQFRLKNGLAISGTREEMAMASELPSGFERNEANLRLMEKMLVPAA